MEPQNKPKKNLGLIIGSIVVVAVSIVAVMSNKKNTEVAIENNSSTNVPVDTTPITDTTTPVDVVKKTTYIYKDGDYSAIGSYMSPGGLDKVDVKLTLKNDTISSITVLPMAGDNTSSRYQAKFISGYKEYVVGKNIADIHLTKVSGSSLTPIGFNDALAQIKSKAKA